MQDTILEKISNLDSKIEKTINLVSRLTEEIVTTKHFLKKLVVNLEQNDLNILPEVPFERSDSFLKYDSEMKDSSQFSTLVSIH